LGTSVGKMWLAPSQPHINPLPEGDEVNFTPLSPHLISTTLRGASLLEERGTDLSPASERGDPDQIFFLLPSPSRRRDGDEVERGDISSEDYSTYTHGKEILINDTIGFIRDLPPELIRAFSSTLEDSIEADILLHVIDAHDPKVLEKIDIVETTLSSIGAKQQRIYVFNKIDNMSELAILMMKEQFTQLDPLFISAVSGRGIDELKGRISDLIR
ncbi:MAG: hypothetical protein PHH70_03085, partial [Candidatus Gracilibacteria bacterium]|nr:hypothetical protein [Candidatus Gracilibacteria bacterium]